MANVQDYDLLPKTRSFVLKPGEKPAPPKGIPPSRRSVAPPEGVEILETGGSASVANGPRPKPQVTFSSMPEPPGMPPTMKPVASFREPPKPPGLPPALAKIPLKGGDDSADKSGGEAKPSEAMKKVQSLKSLMSVKDMEIQIRKSDLQSDDDTDDEGEHGDDDEDDEDEDEEEVVETVQDESVMRTTTRSTMILRPPPGPPPGLAAAGGGAQRPGPANNNNNNNNNATNNNNGRPHPMAKTMPQSFVPQQIPTQQQPQLQQQQPPHPQMMGGRQAALQQLQQQQQQQRSGVFAAANSPAIAMAAAAQQRQGSLRMTPEAFNAMQQAREAENQRNMQTRYAVGSGGGWVSGVADISTIPQQQQQQQQQPAAQPQYYPSQQQQPQPQQQQSGDPWTKVWSPEYQTHYWFNSQTNSSTWEDPYAVVTSPISGSFRSGGGGSFSSLSTGSGGGGSQLAHGYIAAPPAHKQIDRVKTRERRNSASSSDGGGKPRFSLRATLVRALTGKRGSGSGTDSNAASEAEDNETSVFEQHRQQQQYQPSGDQASDGSGSRSDNQPVRHTAQYAAGARHTHVEVVAEVRTKKGTHAIVRSKPKKKDRRMRELAAERQGADAAAGGQAQSQVIVRALYDFTPSDPTNLSELPLAAGEMVSVYEQGADGWWGGTRYSDGRSGLFPASYVQYV